MLKLYRRKWYDDEEWIKILVVAACVVAMIACVCVVATWRHREFVPSELSPAPRWAPREPDQVLPAPLPEDFDEALPAPDEGQTV